MTLTDKMDKLANSFRQSTGLTDKLSLTDMTNLVEIARFPNLIPNTSDKWIETTNQWNNNLITIPIKFGESIAYNFEYKTDANDGWDPRVFLVLYDKDGKMLNPWEIHDGVRPITDSSAIAGFWMAMTTNDARTRKSGVYTIDAKNVASIQSTIGSRTSITFQYRKPMLTYGKRNLPWTSQYLTN